MSLPREWSLHHNQQSLLQQQQQQQQANGDLLLGRSLDNATTNIISGCDDAASQGVAASSQDVAAEHHHHHHHHDENMNNNQHHNLLGSLFSIHSAPAYDVSGNPDNNSSIRPASLVVQAQATSTPVVPPHLSPPDTLEDEDNDNLLTISSLTARPLIAKSRELSKKRATDEKKKKKKKQQDDASAKRRKQKRKRKKLNLEPLDGGYGWVIVTGAFFVQFWVAGLVKSYGVFYVEVMEMFTGASASLASWIPAILSCLCLALAPITSMLSQKYSCRAVVFFGGLFCSLGLMLSYFATNLIHLLFTFGVLTGIGGGLSTTPGIILVSQYFDAHRALANGICVSGTAAGSFVFPLLIEYLVAHFGFHGTLLILGGCMLHVCVSASLYRPLEKNYKDDDDEVEEDEDVAVANGRKEPTVIVERETPEAEIKRQKLEMLFANDPTAKNNMVNQMFHQNNHANEVAVGLTDSEEEKDIMGESLRMKPIAKIRSSSILHSVEDLSTDSTCFYKSRSSQRSLRASALAVCPRDSTGDVQRVPSEAAMHRGSSLTAEQLSTKKKSLSQRINRYIDLSLLREPRFILMCLSVTLMSTGSPYMLYYLPAYVHASGYTKPEAGYLVAISAVLDLCGRLGLGYLSDLQLFDRRKCYISSIVGAGIAVLMVPLAQSFYVLACSVSIYGLCLGSWFLLVPVLLADQYGTDKISSSYGLVRMFQSIGAITVPPLAGFMRDVTGSYDVCFLFMGTCMLMGGLPLLLVSDDNKAKQPDEETAAPTNNWKIGDDDIFEKKRRSADEC